MKLVRADYAAHEKRAEKIRRLMVEDAATLKPKKVAVMLSSGVDSHCALFAALEAGKQVACYTFGLETANSKDVRVAARTADNLGLDWTFIPLTPDVKTLQLHVLHAYRLGKGYEINKSSVECLWPLLETLAEIKESVTLNGLGGDVPFATTRSWKKIVEAGGIPAYENLKSKYIDVMSGPIGDIQTLCMRRWIAKHKRGHVVHSIFHNPKVMNCFTNMHPLTEGNKPTQKAPCRLAFYDYFQRCPALTHQSFQKGDSGISDAFEILLSTSWNTGNFKSVKAIYNAVARGEITRPD